MAVLAAILQFFTNCIAQNAEIRISVADGSANVSGKFADGFRPSNPKNLVFAATAAGNADIGGRVSDVELSGQNAERIGYKRFSLSEFVADSEFASWSYSVDLTPPKNRAGAAHASWVSDELGFLMLDDLVPQFGPEVWAKVSLLLPEGWRSPSENVFEVDNLSDPVIFIGRNFRATRMSVGEASIDLVVAGKWHFTDAEAAEMVKEIFAEYVKIFGAAPAKKFQVAIAKFPDSPAAGIWEAETRGTNVTILSSDMPFRTRSLQRLHEQLRHELFHLWLPNGVKLSGDYAWFYEGFALYQSLKLAVALNRIRFEDFLDTLARAREIDDRQNPRISLIEMSKRSGAADTQTYARGMLIAFLMDIELLRTSKEKRDVSDLLRGIFERYRNPKSKTDANHAVLSYIGLQEITERYVSRADKIEWQNTLSEIGIETSGGALSVKRKLTGRQKKILDRMGYNNWRKLASRR